MFGGIAKKIAVPLFSLFTLIGCSSSNHIYDKYSKTETLIKLIDKHGFDANLDGNDYTYLAFPVSNMRMEIGVFGDRDSLIINEHNLETKISDTEFKDENIDGLGEGDYIRVFNPATSKFISIYPSDVLSDEQKQASYDVVLDAALERVRFFFEQNLFERMRTEDMIQEIYGNKESDYTPNRIMGHQYSMTKFIDSETKIKIVYVDKAPYYFEEGNTVYSEDEFKIIYLKKNNKDNKFYPSKIMFDKGINSFGEGDFIAEVEGMEIKRNFSYSEDKHKDYRAEAWKIMDDAEHSLGLK